MVVRRRYHDDRQIDRTVGEAELHHIWIRTKDLASELCLLIGGSKLLPFLNGPFDLLWLMKMIRFIMF